MPGGSVGQAPEGTPPARSELDVLGIGHAIVDVLAHVDDEFSPTRPGQGVDGADRCRPGRRPLRALGPAVEVSGGSTANTLAGVASFGGRAAFVGKVRDDQLGEVFAHDIPRSACGTRRPAARGPARPLAA